MKKHVYGDAWRLAVAMRHPYPHPAETGDVAASEVVPTPPPTFNVLTRDWSMTEKTFALLGAFATGALVTSYFAKRK